MYSSPNPLSHPTRTPRRVSRELEETTVPGAVVCRCREEGEFPPGPSGWGRRRGGRRRRGPDGRREEASSDVDVSPVVETGQENGVRLHVVTRWGVYLPYRPVSRCGGRTNGSHGSCTGVWLDSLNHNRSRALDTSEEDPNGSCPRDLGSRRKSNTRRGPRPLDTPSTGPIKPS